MPATSIPKASSAATSLCAPRLTQRWPAATVSRASFATRSPALRSVRAPSPSPTRTWPAMTSAWARARDSASPRSTSSRSSRDPPRGGRRHLPIVAYAPLPAAYPASGGPAALEPAAAQACFAAGTSRPSWAIVSSTCAVRPGTSSRISRRRSVTDAVVDEPVARDPDRAHRDRAVRRVGEPRLLERLEHRRPEPAGHDALLERHDERLAACLVEDQLAVERLHEPGVDRRRPTSRAPRARRRPGAPAR